MESDNWMKKLASHYKDVREARRNQQSSREMIILFDIDGTILDHRFLIHHVLSEYDRLNETSLFDDLSINDIDVHENELDQLLQSLELSNEQQSKVTRFYKNHRRTNPAVMEAHRPFQGVMDVIRWFQLQPRTHVGLNTGRPEELRDETLQSLNRLGREYKVKFSDDLLHMNSSHSRGSVQDSKIEGIMKFQSKGFDVVAMVDNEPKNLAAVAEADCSEDILLLHADTIFETREGKLPDRTIRGTKYEITDLIQGHSEPGHIHFVWDGVNDRDELERFLDTRIHWGKVDLRTDPATDELLLRGETFQEKPINNGNNDLTLTSCSDAFSRENRGLIVNLGITEEKLSSVLKNLENSKLSDKDLGFQFDVGQFSRKYIRKIKKAFPDALLQTSIDFLSSMILSEPEKAKNILRMYEREYELDHYTISWQLYQKRKILRTLQDWGFNVNIENVPGLERFLQAALLLPYSVTVNFRNKPYQSNSPGFEETPNPDISTMG